MSTIIKHKEFPNHKVYETVVAGRPLKIEVGKMAELANAAAMVTYGETSVLVAVTASPRPARSGPRRRQDERIFPTYSSGILWPDDAFVSTVRTPFSRLHLQPRLSNIPIMEKTSSISGT